MTSTAKHFVALVVGSFAMSTANAYVIGAAIDDDGSTVDGGTLSDPIDFYIPISDGASGSYGDTGLSSDTCYYPDCGGWLDMTLRFAPTTAGPATMYLGFEDLDLWPFYNDPYYFTESLTARHGSDELSYAIAAANRDYQLLRFDVMVGPGAYYDVDLHFESTLFVEGGAYRNTQEHMAAVLKPKAVPEPTTLSLLGAGLFAIGWAGARRRKRPAPRGLPAPRGF